MKRILVVSHGAGGAEIISAWIAHHVQYDYSFIIEGPAVEIFDNQLGQVNNLPSGILDNPIDPTNLMGLLEKYNLILTGSSLTSSLEIRAIQFGKKTQTRVVTYLDHWMEYRERLTVNNELFLPDELWLGDTHAMKIAEQVLPECRRRLEPNCYFMDMAIEISELRDYERNPEKGLRILYVTEPLSEIAITKYGKENYYGYTEFQALQGFLEYLRTQPVKIEKIRIRHDRAEDPRKYHSIVQFYRSYFSIEMEHPTHLSQDCAWADWVVGCQSMAMAISVQAGIETYCAIPKGGGPLSLPFPEIKRLFQ